MEPLPALTNGVIVSFSPQKFCRFYSLFSRVLENKDFLVTDFGRRLVLLDRVHCGNSDELLARSVRSVKRGKVPLIRLQALEARPSLRAPAPSLHVKRPVNGPPDLFINASASGSTSREKSSPTKTPATPVPISDTLANAALSAFRPNSLRMSRRDLYFALESVRRSTEASCDTVAGKCLKRYGDRREGPGN